MIEKIARIAHGINKAYCESIGDNSLKNWDESGEWMKNSVMNGVKYQLEYSGPPKKLHENWMKEKKENGWKYGEVKDPVKKEHPCFLPYDELDQAQKSKDWIFTAVVQELRGLACPKRGLTEK